MVSGPAAGFGPAASGGVELTTDGQGMATAEIVQRSPQSGVTEVSVQLYGRREFAGIRVVSAGKHNDEGHVG